MSASSLGVLGVWSAGGWTTGFLEPLDEAEATLGDRVFPEDANIGLRVCVFGWTDARWHRVAWFSTRARSLDLLICFS